MNEGRRDPFQKAVENSKAAVENAGKPRDPNDMQEAWDNLFKTSLDWLHKKGK